MPTILPPDGLEWLHLGIFTKTNLAVDSLHFGVDFNALLALLSRKPYLQKDSWSLPGCLVFILGLSIGLINVNIAQYVEPPSKWDNSCLGIMDLEMLHEQCMEFCKDFQRLKTLEDVPKEIPVLTHVSTMVQQGVELVLALSKDLPGEASAAPTIPGALDVVSSATSAPAQALYKTLTEPAKTLPDEGSSHSKDLAEAQSKHLADPPAEYVFTFIMKESPDIMSHFW